MLIVNKITSNFHPAFVEKQIILQQWSFLESLINHYMYQTGTLLELYSKNSALAVNWAKQRQ